MLYRTETGYISQIFKLWKLSIFRVQIVVLKSNKILPLKLSEVYLILRNLSCLVGKSFFFVRFLEQMHLFKKYRILFYFRRGVHKILILFHL